MTYEVEVQTVSFNMRVFSSISGELLRKYITCRGPKVLGPIHLHCMCIKVVKSLVSVPYFQRAMTTSSFVTTNLLDAFTVRFGCVSDYFVPDRN